MMGQSSIRASIKKKKITIDWHGAYYLYVTDSSLKFFFFPGLNIFYLRFSIARIPSTGILSETTKWNSMLKHF